MQLHFITSTQEPLQYGYKIMLLKTTSPVAWQQIVALQENGFSGIYYELNQLSSLLHQNDSYFMHILKYMYDTSVLIFRNNQPNQNCTCKIIVFFIYEI